MIIRLVSVDLFGGSSCYAEVGGRADFFFGLDRPFAKYATALYGIIKSSKQADEIRCRLGRIDFPQAKHTPALQAADLLAYYTAVHIDAHPDGPELPGPLLHLLLAGTIEQADHSFFNAETMRAQIADVASIAPSLAFEYEDEQQLP